MEELREYINNYRLNNNTSKTNLKNVTTKYFSNNELIHLLESDTLLDINDSSKKSHLTEKTIKNNVEDQDIPNVVKVALNDIEGLNLKLRESFYSKLNSALLNNYEITFNKKDGIFLTKSNICDVAKKMEYDLLFTTKDLDSYKLAGSGAIVNIEKETCKRTLYKSLCNEIDLLKLRNKMQRSEVKNTTEQPSVFSTKASSCKECESNAAVSDTEYFSCENANHSLVEFEQKSEICTMNTNTQNPIINLPNEKQLTEIETTDSQLRLITTNNNVSTCNNNDYIEKIPTVPKNVSSEVPSSNVKDLVRTNRILPKEEQNDKKQKVQRHSEPSTKCLSVQQNKNCIKIYGKNPKLIKSEMTSEMSTTNTDANNKNKQKYDSHLNNCLQVRLDVNAEKKNVTVANENQQLQPVKLEPSDIKTKSILKLYLSSSRHNEEQTLSENVSTKETILHKKCSEMSINGKIENSIKKNSSQDRIDELEIFSTNITCQIKDKLDNLQYSIVIDDNKYIDENVWNYYAEKKRKSVSVDKVSKKCCINNDSTGSLGIPVNSNNSIEVTATNIKRFPDANASTDTNNSIVKENNCLIDEEAFELERARLNKLYEEMEKCSEENNVNVIHSDYEKVFAIIIPIIRKYYPSEFIPDEVCYGHILQRLQIDLTHADMCDNDKEFYIKDSIKTRRYLCENCIVQ
ncbi:uncharacterized protein LOC131668659 [Phymastichus coffea]|uniref:uncharacterized protein LOC131668659 n=1 Tax=Phymastichus coffea TaxID=108790 RepID=UPI00273C08D5|nr:uncharacterized protein LOC131668659 [Phymastichus coffea]